MPPTYLLTLPIWAPLSFLLHNVVHEGAHAIAVKLGGGRVVDFWPFPARVNGRWFFAYMKYAHLPKDKELGMLLAPLWADVVWLTTFAGLLTASFVFDLNPILKLVFMVECVSSIIDAAVWGLGWLRKSKGSDGDRAREIICKT